MLRVNDVFVVCDAGGGTVDLISYTITGISPLEMVETTVGSGGLCGAQHLNINFEEHVKRRIGTAKFRHYKLDKPKSWRIALDNFEDRVKRWFGAVSMTEFEIPLHGMEDDMESGIEDGCLVLTVDQLKEIFDPVVTDVIALVEHQVSKVRDQGSKVAAILCVGGFGQSAYLFKQLKSHFQTDLPPPYSSRHHSGCANTAVTDINNASIEIMQPSNAWTSVLRGAVELGFAKGIVSERQCRYNYGIRVNPIFVAGIHPISSKYWDDFDNCWRACNSMSWYVSKGEAVSAEREIILPVCKNFEDVPQEGVKQVVNQKLLASSLASAPVMYHADTTFVLCTVAVDVSGVPKRLFRLQTNGLGKKRYKLSMDLIMKIDSATIQFEVKVDGQSYGLATASFDH